MSSSSDFQQDRHNFSGSQQKWKDFELPGNLKKKKKSRYTDFSFKLLCTFICLFVCLLEGLNMCHGVPVEIRGQLVGVSLLYMDPRD
jgi:hypothetical protein